MFPPVPVGRLRSVLISLSLACSPTLLHAFPEQSVSTSRQFIVYGADVALRGAICDLAERTKRDLLVLLAQRDSWTIPIVINAQYPQANLPGALRCALTVSQTGFGLRLQVDLTIDSALSRPKIRRELLRVLLVEMMYRGENNPPAETFTASPPEWLIDGIPARQSDLSTADLKILAVPVFRDAILPLTQFLGQNPELLDGPGQSLYRAYARVLVDLLTGVPDGPDRLARFVRELPSAGNDPATALRLHFPELFDSEAKAEKRWKDRVGRLSVPQHHQFLNSIETERILNQLLRFKISEAGAVKTFELAEFPRFVKHSSAKRVLPVLARELNALAARANPIYRPLLLEYGKITAALLRGKTKGVVDRLAALRLSRRAMAVRVRAIDDYLNWFEATELRSSSGLFLDYMKAAESAGQPARRKHDPISVYIDSLEAQMEN